MANTLKSTDENEVTFHSKELVSVETSESLSFDKETDICSPKTIRIMTKDEYEMAIGKLETTKMCVNSYS